MTSQSPAQLYCLPLPLSLNRPARPPPSRSPPSVPARAAAVDIWACWTPIKIAPGSLTMRSVSFRVGVAWAYGVKEFQVTGPDWIDQARYDIVAKAAGPASAGELRVMLRTLLAERFKLVSHRQTKEMSAWVLTVGKNGPKFKESQEEGEASIEPNLSKMEVVVRRTPVSQLADLLGKILRAPVLDQTGLNGKYDITVRSTNICPIKAPQST